MVQPDVLVVCDENNISEERVYGAPDLVIEVLSPSTRRKDLFIKAKKYSDAGVRECWIVDPRDEQVIVYDYENDNTVSAYTFRDQIPVGIFGGDLVIDFAEIASYML